MKQTKVTRAAFKLLKVKKIGGGSIAYKYKTIFDDGGVQNEKIHTVESTYMAHPDLLQLFDELGELYIKACGHDVVFNITKLELAKTKSQKDSLKDVHGMLKAMNIIKYDMISSTGAALSYTGGEISDCVITGKQSFNNGKSVGSSTPLIKLGLQKLGIEDALTDVCERLHEEVYCFEFEGKKAQTEMNFEEGKKEDATDDMALKAV